MALDINGASAEELASLPGIDTDLAINIVEYRDENGGFTSIDDLRDIPGCTKEVVAGLRDLGVTAGAGVEGPQM